MSSFAPCTADHSFQLGHSVIRPYVVNKAPASVVHRLMRQVLHIMCSVWRNGPMYALLAMAIVVIALLSLQVPLDFQAATY
jgi:hypothetical protein